MVHTPMRHQLRMMSTAAGQQGCCKIVMQFHGGPDVEWRMFRALRMSEKIRVAFQACATICLTNEEGLAHSVKL